MTTRGQPCGAPDLSDQLRYSPARLRAPLA